MVMNRLQNPTLEAPSESIAFIDLEASGLHARSWPVEVGWAFLSGDPISYLVCPQDDWLNEGWDENAEKIHGLSKDFLLREGSSPIVICTRLNEALSNVDVYSDAPDWDSFWLYRLYRAANLRPAFALNSFGDLMRPYSENDKDAALIEAADRLAPRRHRAAADARHLQTLYSLARQA